MTDLMARKSKRLPDLVRTKLRARSKLIQQLRDSACSTHRTWDLAGRLRDLNLELAEVLELLEPPDRPEATP